MKNFFNWPDCDANPCICGDTEAQLRRSLKECAEKLKESIKRWASAEFALLALGCRRTDAGWERRGCNHPLESNSYCFICGDEWWLPVLPPSTSPVAGGGEGEVEIFRRRWDGHADDKSHHCDCCFTEARSLLLSLNSQLTAAQAMPEAVRRLLIHCVELHPYELPPPASDLILNDCIEEVKAHYAQGQRKVK